MSMYVFSKNQKSTGCYALQILILLCFSLISFIGTASAATAMCSALARYPVFLRHTPFVPLGVSDNKVPKMLILNHMSLWHCILEGIHGKNHIFRHIQSMSISLSRSTIQLLPICRLLKKPLVFYENPWIQSLLFNKSRYHIVGYIYIYPSH
jgi:hypothetical protein